MRALRLLVVQDDARLMRIARLASALFDVPTALMTLVDEAHVQPVAAVGTPYEVPCEQTFCTHVVLQDDVLVVEDAARDPRFVDNALMTAEGGIRFYAGAPLRSPDGHAVGALCLLAPRPRAFTTDERQLLADLASLASDELHARHTSAALTEAAARLQHIVGMASHDLRGVLASVIGYAHSLHELLPVHSIEADFARSIAEVGTRASTLMHELLETAILEGGALRLEPEALDLAALVRACVRDHQMQAHRKDQTLHLGGPDTVTATGDSRRLRQVLDNLVSNALKYSPRGATVRVEVLGAPGFAVEDEGPGFTEAEAERAFHPYARISNEPTGGEASTGLGLSIAAELVRLHGGTIRLETARNGHSARFVVTLPASGP
ncbi:MAG TPA: GAF domain-containing sensor histidine kinase [Rhodothermales bacterium]|nr:GAF domain-containing sensor histidine kinase [Rhodothermales bacterium]